MESLIDSNISTHIKNAVSKVLLGWTGYNPDIDIDIDEETNEICLESLVDVCKIVAIRFTSTNVVSVVVILDSDLFSVERKKSREYLYDEDKNVNVEDILATIRKYVVW